MNGVTIPAMHVVCDEETGFLGDAAVYVQALRADRDEHKRMREANGGSLKACAEELDRERQLRQKEQELRLKLLEEIRELKEELRSARLTLVSGMRG